MSKLIVHETQSLEAGAVSELLGIARFKFHDGKLEEFRRLSAQARDSEAFRHRPP